MIRKPPKQPLGSKGEQDSGPQKAAQAGTGGFEFENSQDTAERRWRLRESCQPTGF